MEEQTYAERKAAEVCNALKLPTSGPAFYRIKRAIDDALFEQRQVSAVVAQSIEKGEDVFTAIVDTYLK